MTNLPATERVSTSLTTEILAAVEVLAIDHDLSRGQTLRALITWAVDHPSSDRDAWLDAEADRSADRASEAGRAAARKRWEHP